MTSTVIRYLYLLLLICLLSGISAFASEFKKPKAGTVDSITFKSPFYEDNERCFKCHGQKTYEYLNENLDRNVKALMFSERVIDRNKFYQSNHKSFSCTDCHSADYVKFPHPGELRMEQTYNCIDCHGGDEKFAQYNFEEIESEYQKSTHFQLEKEGFSCWECHGPHTYKLNIRNSSDIKEAIIYDNNICLKCHSNYDQFQLLSDKDEINILQKHDWLPNQETHFRSVRCIECHSEINDSILVSHLILPVEKAVRKCNECHSQNSILMSTLYKFQSKEQRKDGFLNGIILNQSYVIGANRNEYLNIISLLIFGVVVLIIGIHIYFRLTRK
jgi:hypothetical protein